MQKYKGSGMHPKLRQLQQMQDSHRLQWQRPVSSRLTTVAASAAAVYTDSMRLVLGALAVALMSVLLTAAFHRIAQVGTPQRGADTAMLAPQINLTLANRAMTIARKPSAKRTSNSAPARGLGGPPEPATGAEKLFLDSRTNQSSLLTALSRAHPPRPKLPINRREKRDLITTEAPLLRRQRRAYSEITLFINDKGGYDYIYFWVFLDPLCVYPSAVCFFYTRKQWEWVASEATLKNCEFSNNYRHAVPTMLRRDFRAKAFEHYLLYLSDLKGYIYCMLNYHSPRCSTHWRVWPNTNYPAAYNDNVLMVMYRMYEIDYWRGSRHEQTWILRTIMSQCALDFNHIYPNRPYYKNKAPLAYTTVIAYYARCLLGHSHYCADPCQEPMACSKDNMFSTCYAVDWPYKEDNKYQRLLDTYFAQFKPVFSRVAYCLCRKGFRYNFESEECEIIPYKCNKKDDCLNNGRCEGVPLHVEMVIGRSYNCECTPAWQGLRCEEARDPCLDPENRASCGEFQCRRSPTEGIHGFVCVCSSGYTLTRQQGKPSCRDINECAISAPCRNGGVCRNLKGSFECICRLSFSGSLCEIPPAEPFWLAWGPWTACSVSCSVGLQHRRRNCSSEGSCIGLQKDFKNCQGPHMDCALASLGGVSPEELAGGAGWREEEDKILDDAWYFREFQLLRLGLNRRAMAEDELVSGWEDLLYLYIHYIALTGAALGIVQLLLCRRIRVRVQGE